MKKHNVLKVVLISILVVVLCTWIFPTAQYQYGLVDGARNQVGIFDLFSYPMVALAYFSYALVFIFATGIFYGVLYKIPAYRELLERIIKLFKGKENMFLAIAMIFIAVLVSVTGLSYAILFLFPFIISVVLLMGYNKLVATSVTVGSAIIGMMGTTLGLQSIVYINYVLGTDVFSEIGSKIIILVIGLVLLIFNVLLYAKKTRNNIDKVENFVPNNFGDSKIETETVTKEIKKTEVKVSKKDVETNLKKPVKNTSEIKKDITKKSASKKTTSKEVSNKKVTSTNKKTSASMAKTDVHVKVDMEKSKKKVAIWPLIVIFDLVIIILAISVFDWANVLEFDGFVIALKAVEEFVVGKFPIFAKILGNVGVFGEWSLNVELPVLILIAAILLAFTYKVKLDDFFDGAIEGLKKALRPAIYILFIYVVLVIVTYHPFQLVIFNFLAELTNGFNVITMTLIAGLSSILNVESLYVAQSTLPYLTGVVEDVTLYPLLAVIFQSIYGLMMLIAPTSVLLIGTLSYLEIPYGQWLKHIWKLFLQLLIILVIIFLVIYLI